VQDGQMPARVHHPARRRLRPPLPGEAPWARPRLPTACRSRARNRHRRPSARTRTLESCPIPTCPTRPRSGRAAPEACRNDFPIVAWRETGRRCCPTAREDDTAPRFRAAGRTLAHKGLTPAAPQSRVVDRGIPHTSARPHLRSTPMKISRLPLVIALSSALALAVGCAADRDADGTADMTPDTTPAEQTPMTPATDTTADTAVDPVDATADADMVDGPGDGQNSDQPVDDTWITTKVKSSLLAESEVSGLDINVDTLNGVVTLRG